MGRFSGTITVVVLFEDESQLPNGNYSEYNMGTKTATVHCKPRATFYDVWDAIVRELLEKAQHHPVRVEVMVRFESLRYKGQYIVGDAELKQPMVDIGYVAGDNLQVGLTQTVIPGNTCTVS